MKKYNKTYKDEFGVKVSSKEYSLWYTMLQRCEVGGKYQERYPTYLGCSVSDTFKDFQMFAEWCNQQVGFGLSGYQLDKDILIEGNKEYNEGVCVFIPQELNKFLLTRAAARGDTPLGVSWDKSNCKFKASVAINGKDKHLGYFDTPTAAHAAYVTAKEAEARRWHKRLREEFVVDPRVIKRMATWKVITDTEMF